ncbi:MAG: thiol peroxidase [Candidatus Omnitrophica bacterium]|nr:thiol peroxidase [Candidatus Omnitrophota bacterium]
MTQAITQTVTFKGNPLTLVGNDVQIGQSAPDATLIANDLSEFQLSSLKGKKVILSAVPSLDTPVCDLQTKRFNSEAVNSGDNVAVITLSMDLPFAQARWCGATGSDQIKTYSDYKSASFGKAYGVLIKELRLLSRAIFVVDQDGILQYKQFVSEITNEPDYDEVLEAARKLSAR